MTSSELAPPRTRPWITLGVLCVTILVISIDNTILNVALPTIVRTLHATSSQLQWVVDAVRGHVRRPAAHGWFSG